MTPSSIPSQAFYWRRKRRLTLQLLAIWLCSTFLVIYFARDLNDLELFGWPLSYYMAAQGLALVYLALIVIYNRRVSRMEAQMTAQMAEQMKTERQHAG
ncbi:DUF4212 domain-containing protein [Oxalobacteraceae bacterium CAVE-383]|nr:DUF4212 domain-containing protein [Oxalobacteraceae bacterium CAVE-383]